MHRLAQGCLGPLLLRLPVQAQPKATGPGTWTRDDGNMTYTPILMLTKDYLAL